ncbi:MAG: WecB/TagA/CpsF family glycosyltransferase, partial [Gammaproteobacteria bacterium]|nr:WecB/TagA/CpsF family glycosyltransferase [Gammaproteobacteria bacterium]
DVLWVGMTAPKQEKWIEENRSKLKTSTVGAIGAVFDFFAGTYPRAPIWAARFGIEWLFRLIKEPKRMWKRNFVSTPVFLFQCFIQHVILRKHKNSTTVD